MEQLKSEFKMSMVTEMSYFLGLYVSWKKEGIFVSQSKYAKNLVKEFGLESTSHKRPQQLLISKLVKMSLE